MDQEIPAPATTDLPLSYKCFYRASRADGAMW